MFRKEWQAVRSLTNSKTIRITKTDKGFSEVASDRSNYLLETEKQLNNTKKFRDATNTKNILSKLS